MNQIIYRDAEDDFKAFLTAQAIENSGATVFSITPNGEGTYPFCSAPHRRFIVWAKYQEPFDVDAMDELITKAYEEKLA